jgi:hypothetical protein
VFASIPPTLCRESKASPLLNEGDVEEEEDSDSGSESDGEDNEQGEDADGRGEEEEDVRRRRGTCRRLARRRLRL